MGDGSCSRVAGRPANVRSDRRCTATFCRGSSRTPADEFAVSSACSGTSGFVQLAYNLQTGEQVAIKFIERGIQMQRIVARELLNHRMCALHPHIVQLKVRGASAALVCKSAGSHLVHLKAERQATS